MLVANRICRLQNPQAHLHVLFGETLHVSGVHGQTDLAKQLSVLAQQPVSPTA